VAPCIAVAPMRALTVARRDAPDDAALSRTRSGRCGPALPSRRALSRCRLHRIAHPPPRVRDGRDTGSREFQDGILSSVSEKLRMNAIAFTPRTPRSAASPTSPHGSATKSKRADRVQPPHTSAGATKLRPLAFIQEIRIRTGRRRLFHQ
jgi:hypothetical protein